MSNRVFVKTEILDEPTRRVFEIPGEPAIVINGSPVLVNLKTKNRRATTNRKAGKSAEKKSDVDKGFGEWLEGREVKKLFGDKYYSGTVTEFDKEAGWYKVVYEDGDSEDLDWQELEQVIVPMDIMIPLKTLALKTIKRGKKTNKRGSPAT